MTSPFLSILYWNWWINIFFLIFNKIESIKQKFYFNGQICFILLRLPFFWWILKSEDTTDPGNCGPDSFAPILRKTLEKIDVDKQLSIFQWVWKLLFNSLGIKKYKLQILHLKHCELFTIAL